MDPTWSSIQREGSGAALSHQPAHSEIHGSTRPRDWNPVVGLDDVMSRRLVSERL